MKDCLMKRPKFTHDNLLKELSLSSPEDYENYLRMDHSTFLDLLNRVEPFIKKRDTNMRDCIPVSNTFKHFVLSCNSQQANHLRS